MWSFIEIRYAPGGDENNRHVTAENEPGIEIRYAPGGDENEATGTHSQ